MAFLLSPLGMRLLGAALILLAVSLFLGTVYHKGAASRQPEIDALKIENKVAVQTNVDLTKTLADIQTKVTACNASVAKLTKATADATASAAAALVIAAANSVFYPGEIERLKALSVGPPTGDNCAQTDLILRGALVERLRLNPAPH